MTSNSSNLEAFHHPNCGRRRGTQTTFAMMLNTQRRRRRRRDKKNNDELDINHRQRRRPSPTTTTIAIKVQINSASGLLGQLSIPSRMVSCTTSTSAAQQLISGNCVYLFACQRSDFCWLLPDYNGSLLYYFGYFIRPPRKGSSYPGTDIYSLSHSWFRARHSPKLTLSIPGVECGRQ